MTGRGARRLSVARRLAVSRRLGVARRCLAVALLATPALTAEARAQQPIDALQARAQQPIDALQPPAQQPIDALQAPAQQPIDALQAPAQQQAEASEALFQRGTEALARGEYGAAIDLLEQLADRGFVHPDASYNRGLAYVTRVREGADRPGDLGRAAAAFEEALRLRPGDEGADRALDLVRAEITRRRSRRAKDAVDVRPTLDRVVVGLASERSWAAASLAASLLLAAGLVLRRRPAGPAHVAGSVLAPTALVALLALVPLTYAARHLRLTTRAGVVVVPEVRLVDETGRALTSAEQSLIPEGASVEVGARSGGLARVRWGASEGWVPLASIRLLAP